MAGDLDNANPVIYQKAKDRDILPENEDEDVVDEIDTREVFGIVPSPMLLNNLKHCYASLIGPNLIRIINDPEHPLSLEELKVVEESRVQVSDQDNYVKIEFTPTIPHCSMATLIGLSIRVKLIRSLPARFKVDVSITPGTHASEEAVNKQLADKERVAAALENSHLLEVVNQCLSARR